MPQTGKAQTDWLKRGASFLVFFVVEMMVFAIIPLSARLSMKILIPSQASLVGILLVAALLLRRSTSGRQYWQITYAFFVAGVAVLLSILYSDDLMRLFGLTATNPQGIAAAKLSESILRVAAILVLMAIVGADRRSLFLNRGKISLGLAIGVAGFVALAGIAFAPLVKQPGTVGKLLSLSPWILVFVLANGFMEELLFRGLFLRRYQTFLGRSLSNVLAALVFTLVHVQVTCVPDMLQFLVVVFPLALVWGYLMQKTDSLWGSALFHAGADCLIIFGIFASLRG